MRKIIGSSLAWMIASLILYRIAVERLGWNPDAALYGVFGVSWTLMAIVCFRRYHQRGMASGPIITLFTLGFLSLPHCMHMNSFGLVPIVLFMAVMAWWSIQVHMVCAKDYDELSWLKVAAVFFAFLMATTPLRIMQDLPLQGDFGSVYFWTGLWAATTTVLMALEAFAWVGAMLSEHTMRATKQSSERDLPTAS